MDTNPIKIKGHQNWFDSIKNSRQFSNLEYEELCAGLNEAKANFDLISEENAFVTPNVYNEFKKFHDLVFLFYNYFENNNGNKLKGSRAKKNKYIYDLILDYISNIDRSFANSIYDVTKRQGYDLLEKQVILMDRNLRKKTNKNYSQGDISLITTALFRSRYNQKTRIFTPDSDIPIILKNFKNKNYNSDLIKVEYTYFKKVF